MALSAHRSGRSTVERRRSLGERSAVARSMLATAVGRASGALAMSPVLRWRHGGAVPDHVLVLPRDLRTADPSFATELRTGTFGLSTATLVLNRERPFDIVGADPVARAELHGFGWLRHLTVSEDLEARELGASLIVSWTAAFGGDRKSEIWQTGVAARRTLSWLAHAAPLLDDADPRHYDRWLQSLGDHLVHLSATWSAGRDGADRLLAAVARLAGDVCVAGRDRYLPRSASDLARELARQVDGDGGHLSRDGDVLVELLLDLLPVLHCARARDIELPPPIGDSVARMSRMVRHLRVGASGLARFHGAGRSGVDAVTTVLGHEADLPDQVAVRNRGGYVRLESGRIAALIDAGPPPPVMFAGRAHASALALEIEIDRVPVIVNCAPGPNDDVAHRAEVRATASHSTLVLAERSSATLLASPTLERIAGAPPLVMTGQVRFTAEDDATGWSVDAEHEGYLETTGLVHRRRIHVDTDGRVISGVDTLAGPRGGTVRLKQDLPFAIRFHLGTEVRVVDGPWPDGVLLGLPNGEAWQFLMSGAARLTLEDSRRCDGLMSLIGVQIVLRGSTFGETEVAWRLSRCPGRDLSVATLED